MIEATSENGGLRGVVAIGASAGGVEALSRLAAGSSADMPYAYLVTLHRYSGLAEETERALKVLSDRLASSGSRGGDGSG